MAFGPVLTTATVELLSVLKNQTADVLERGGPIIHLDGWDPSKLNEPSLQDLQTWILIAMGGFFTFITVFGCLLVFVQLGVIPVNGAGQIILTPEAIRRARRLLTREEVARFQPGGDLHGKCPADEVETQPSDETTSGTPVSVTAVSVTTANTDLPFDPEEDQNCAVCLDELASGAAEGDHDCSTLCLPCGHNFHLECIVSVSTGSHSLPFSTFDSTHRSLRFLGAVANRTSCKLSLVQVRPP